MSFCGYTSPDLLVHIEVFSFFLLLIQMWSSDLVSAQVPDPSDPEAAYQEEAACTEQFLFKKLGTMSTYFIVSSLFKHLFFISPLSQFLWTIWSEGALCRPSTAAEHGVKGASVAWTALHRKPIVGYEVWTREQTGSEPCRKPADSTCAQCFHFKRQLHPPMTKVLRKLLSLSEAAQRLQPFSNNHDILCWSLELFELWGYFFLASPLFCCGE